MKKVYVLLVLLSMVSFAPVVNAQADPRDNCPNKFIADGQTMMLVAQPSVEVLGGLCQYVGSDGQRFGINKRMAWAAITFSSVQRPQPNDHAGVAFLSEGKLELRPYPDTKGGGFGFYSYSYTLMSVEIGGRLDEVALITLRGAPGQFVQDRDGNLYVLYYW